MLAEERCNVVGGKLWLEDMREVTTLMESRELNVLPLIPEGFKDLQPGFDSR